MAYVNLNEMAYSAFADIEKKQYKSSEEKLDYLLNIYPNDPVLYYFLGCLYHAQSRWAFSIMAFEKALTYQPNFDECLNNVGSCYRAVGLLDKAIESFLHAIEIAKHEDYIKKCNGDETRAKKNLADYLGNLGSCYIASGMPDKALIYLNQSCEIMSRPNTLWNKGLALLEKGDYDHGFKCYKAAIENGISKLRNYRTGDGDNVAPLWDGTPGKTIVLYGEQGIGDEIMFASMLSDVLKDNQVIIDAHPRLVSLFRASFPGVPVYGTRKATQITWLNYHKVDACLPLSHLGQFYRHKKEDFPGIPYLVTDAKLDAYLQEKFKSVAYFGSKPKIGLSWKGGVGSTNKPSRSIPMELLKPLFSFDAHFISLQYHVNGQAEVDKFNESMGYEAIIHWQDVIDDYDLTARLLTHLDLVISVPQSVVHLAGALGVQTIQMCPMQALWQMGPYGQNAPWYKSVENYWQPKDGDWESVIAQICKTLEMEGYKHVDNGRI